MERPPVSNLNIQTSALRTKAFMATLKLNSYHLCLLHTLYWEKIPQNCMSTPNILKMIKVRDQILNRQALLLIYGALPDISLSFEWLKELLSQLLNN